MVLRRKIEQRVCLLNGLLSLWKTFRVCLAGHWCFENCWWLHYDSTCNRLSVASVDSNVDESAELAVTRNDSEQFSIYVLPREATPILFRLDMIRGFVSLDRDASLSQ